MHDAAGHGTVREPAEVSPLVSDHACETAFGDARIARPAQAASGDHGDSAAAVAVAIDPLTVTRAKVPSGEDES
jgi:hypothetical protein